MKKKIFMAVSISILLLVIIAIAIVGNYFYDLALNPEASKTIVFGEDTPQTEEQILKQMQKEKWLEDTSKDIQIESKDGLLLHGYEIAGQEENKKWTIVIHGYMSEGKQMIDSSKHFLDMGYNVLIVDLRGHGKSEGDYIGMGWHDRLDIIKWIEYLIKKQPNCEIVLYGVSMGAATVMMTTGEELPGNVKCAIEDCGYTSVWDEFAAQLKDLFNFSSIKCSKLSNKNACRIFF